MEQTRPANADAKGGVTRGETPVSVRRIAIVGLPNTGKSRLYNELTGDYTIVANYPLTTVEIKRRRASIHGAEFEIADTPGLHSLYIHSEEEVVVRDLLFQEPVDGLIQCVDANRLKQSLLLTCDLLELGIPLIIALNAIDETEQEGLLIDSRRLSASLGVPVIEHVAHLNRGTEELRAALAAGDGRPGSWKPDYGAEMEKRIAEIADLLPPATPFARKKALLLLDGDNRLSGGPALPVPDGLAIQLSGRLQAIRFEHRGSLGRELARRRVRQVERLVQETTSRVPGEPGHFAHAFARLCRHPFWGLLILAAFLAVTYLLVVQVAGTLEGFLSTAVVDPLVGAIGERLPPGLWSDLLIGDYGILTLGLFNAFVTVLPILSMFFLMMGILEDIGYLPNLMVLTRRLMSAVGLSGKSVMSLILGFGCKTMATLTTKGISSRKERLIAIYLIAFGIPCSAQLAINMAILGRVGLQAFFIAFASLAFVELGAGFILNRVLPEDRRDDFIQELPPIRMPQPGAVLTKTWYRIYWFLKEAVPIFLIAAAALFLVDRIGLLQLLKEGLRPVVVRWLGLPIDTVDVLILTMARHEAAAGLLLSMVDGGALDYVQSIVAVVITTMFVPCFANIVAMCRQAGLRTGIVMTLAINLSSFVLAGALNWLLLFLRVGPG